MKIKNDSNMESYGKICHVCGLKESISENEHTQPPQSNQYIQHSPYQASSGIFHRTRTNNFTICMEIQKTSNSRSNLEKK